MSRSLLVFLPIAVTLAAAPGQAQSDVSFPREVYAGRRAKLAKQLAGGAAIVPGRYLAGDDGFGKQDPNFWYLTGVESPYAILVMTASRTALFLPGPFQFAGGQFPMADEGFRRAVWNRPIRRLSAGPAASESTGIAETYAIDSFAERLPGLIGGAKRIYLPLDKSVLYAPPSLDTPRTVAQQITASIVAKVPGAQVTDLDPIVRRMRLVKDSYELSYLRQAAEISGRSFLAAMREIRPGRNDREIAGVMESSWKKEGSARAAFAPVVSSGPRSMHFFALLAENYNSTDHVMQAGELIFIDYGAAEYRTYASDLCRTLPVSGTFSSEQRRYYDIVLAAQEAAINTVRPGIMMLDAIKAAAQVFRDQGLEPYEDIGHMGEDRVWGLMPSPTHYLKRNAGIVAYSPQGHGVRDLGHHIGLEVYDSRDYSMPLEAGMVFTMEPKIFIPEKQVAIMIEDMIAVTPNGHEVLSAACPKKAADIERIMSRR